MSQSYRHKETSVFLLNYHIIFCPKRRKKVLVGAVRDKLEELLREHCAELDINVLNLAILPDHLHLFASATPDMAPKQIVAKLKGRSSRYLRQEFPILRRLPSLWTRSFFVSTAGTVASETIQFYIDAQSKRD